MSFPVLTILNGLNPTCGVHAELLKATLIKFPAGTRHA